MVDAAKVEPGDKLWVTGFVHDGELSSVSPVPITVDHIVENGIGIVATEFVEIAGYVTGWLWSPRELDYDIPDVSDTDPVCDAVYFPALKELFGGEWNG